MKDKIAALLMDVGCPFPRSSAEYMIKNNTVVLPCKVGDTVYRVRTEYAAKGKPQEIIETKVKKMELDADGIKILCECSNYSVGLGHLVFLTREAAERAVRGRRNVKQ